MGTIEEIKKMQAQGQTDQEITTTLKQRGISNKEISDSLAQTNIKKAVISPANENQAPAPQSPTAPTSEQPPQPELPSFPPTDNLPPSPKSETLSTEQSNTELTPTMEYPPPAEPTQTEYGGMQPSILTLEQQPQFRPGEQQGQETYPAQDDYGTDAYSQYQPYQEQISSDIITEISEQVMSEKLANLQDNLEKAVDFKTTAEAKLTSLSERLRRIEQIIDRLQLSILQKVGEYVTDVGDIKHELKETQDSFKALLPKLREIHHTSHKKHPKKKKHP